MGKWQRAVVVACVALAAAVAAGAGAAFSEARIADMPAARFGSGAVALGGKCYVFGGYLGSLEALVDTIFVYDIGANSWREAAGRMPYAVDGFPNGVAVWNGKVYISPGIGPTRSNGWGRHQRVIEFDPATETARERASFGATVWGVSPVTIGSYIYWFGACGIGQESKIWRYDPAADTIAHVCNLAGGPRNANAVLGADGRVYVMGGQYMGQAKLHIDIYNPSTNTCVVAPTRLPHHMEYFWPGPGSLIYMARGVDSAQVWAYDTASGAISNTGYTCAFLTTRWQSGMAHEAATRSAYFFGGFQPNAGVFLMNDAYVLREGPQLGSLKWVFPTNKWVSSSPALADDGTIYIGSWDGHLYAINPDGTERWAFASGQMRSSPAVAADGTIYAASDNGSLYAVNPDGTQRWQFPLGAATASTPAIGADGTVYVGAMNGKVFALRPDGSLKWQFATGWEVHSSPAIAPDGTIYVGSYDTRLYALSPSGARKWDFATGNIIVGGPSIGADGTVYIGSADHNFYALNPDGSLKWVFPTGEDIANSAAIGPDGTIYVASNDCYTYALSPSGAMKWRVWTGNGGWSSPAVGADGTLYVGSFDHKLRAISPSGAERWAFATGDCIYSSPTIAPDGTVYVGSNDYLVYALTSDSFGLAGGSWPKFHHDARNTGCLGGAPPSDTTPPTLTCPADITVEQQDAAGTSVEFAATAQDDQDPAPAVVCDPPSGTVFPLGTTIVACTATDAAGNRAEGSFRVTVADTTPPVLVPPEDLRVEQTSPGGTPVDLGEAAALDRCDAAVAITNDAPALFPQGTTLVTWRAVDASGNAATATQRVTVVDTTPPQLLSLQASPSILWPPNNKMAEVAVSAVVADACDPEPTYRIVRVTSNEPILGPGSKKPDWTITGAHTLLLRAKRTSKSGRIYTISVEARDASGNRATATVAVTVPHDMRKPGK